MKTAIWWIRRDLRLFDQQALQQAMQVAEEIIPVFVLDPTLLASPNAGEKRVDFLIEGLRALDQSLQNIGGRLILRQGDPASVLAEIMHRWGAERVFAEADYSPLARKRDEAVASVLPLLLVGGPGVLPPAWVLKPDGKPYTIFTPFSKAWKRTYTVPELAPIPTGLRVPANISSMPIPTKSQRVIFEAGEQFALDQLEKFTVGDDAPIYQYQDSRNSLGRAGTSQLSPYLRFGMLSARHVVQVAMNAIRFAPNLAARQGAEAWLNEIIWRDFYQHILYHYPFVRKRSFRLEMVNIPWRNNENEFAAWCSGATGYPIVDAAMRELATTGWMHNRARMITASFLCKDLLIDWQWGERWFMQQLIDGDPASNNGGWQWAAGTGTDAAPYFRIFNPVLQSKKFDPDGTYIRRWVPELAKIAPPYLHEPWRMPHPMQKQLGCLIGRDYPERIVDHEVARERALRTYRLR